MGLRLQKSQRARLQLLFLACPHMLHCLLRRIPLFNPFPPPFLPLNIFAKRFQGVSALLETIIMAQSERRAAIVPHVFTPPRNPGMVELDRSRFVAKARVPALLAKDPVQVRGYLHRLGPYLLHAPRWPNVVVIRSQYGMPVEERPEFNEPEAGQLRVILLKPDNAEADAVARDLIDHAEPGTLERLEYELTLDYDYWLPDQIIGSVMPEGFVVPSSFEQVGHIAHFNLRDEHEPYKRLVGQVILDKNKSLRTVVNKSNTIDDTYRTFKMEILAGDDDLVAELREASCSFRLDFSKVYWNSRLQGEHERIVRLFKSGQQVCDVFAGIGPFAIPAARHKSCVTYANDLNPNSYQYLVENISRNRIEGLVLPFCMDGREFIRQSLRLLNDPDNMETVRKRKEADRIAAQAVLERLRSKETPTPTTTKAGKPDPLDTRRREASIALDASLVPHRPVFDHYVMNLPATAVLFLDAFRGLLAGVDMAADLKQEEMPVVHVHCFSKAQDLEADALAQVSESLGYRMDAQSPHLIDVHRVRDVAPGKEMLCVSFRLPLEVALAK